MGLVDNILYEFKGQLMYQDVMHMTLKEVGYLRKHRNMLREAAASKQPGGNITQAISDMSQL